MTDLQIWQWTLTKDAVAPCFVRDVLAMRQHSDRDADFFWLGHTPCRTVLLVGMVVAVQVYDKRAIYTIDDGTAVVDCVLRHALPAPAPSKPASKMNPQRSPKKIGTAEPMEPPPPITEPGYPVRVIGKVVRHYDSKQIYADSIDPCPSSLDEIEHLERVIELHKTKYTLAVPFVLPSKPPSSAVQLETSASETSLDASVFSNTSPPSRPGPSTVSYTLPAPPRPMPLQCQNRLPTHAETTLHGHGHVPSSPTTSSIASSTPSSPCKSSSPTKMHGMPHKPKLRHPSRLHARALTTNTFRLYLKHYMDNAPSFTDVCASPSRSVCSLATPTKHSQGVEETGELTPRPYPRTSIKKEKDEQTLGFTLSHLRRVPELALLAARVVRAETRKRDKVEREKEKERNSRGRSVSSAKHNENGSTSAPTARVKSATDPPRKKIKRLFSWAVVKLYEEGSIVLWDGDVRPLPVPPPPSQTLSLWSDDTTRNSTLEWLSASADVSASVLYSASASASLYSHYQAPRRHGKVSERSAGDVDAVDSDADPGCLSDPPPDEEAYVPLTPRLLAGHVGEAVSVLRGHRRGAVGGNGGAKGGEPAAKDVLAYLQRRDARWARVGVWAVEEAFAVLKAA